MPDLEFTPEFEKASSKIFDGVGNMFVTGRAGTGKSTLLRYMRDHMDPPPVVLAPTGVAAINVGGQTIHRFFRFTVGTTPQQIRSGRRKPYDPEIFRQLRTIIIDEASMVRADVIDCVDEFLRRYGPVPRQPFGGVQMVYFGDLFQLPPVVKGEEKSIFSEIYDTPYFFSAPGVEAAGLEIIELGKIFRQKDEEFIGLLNRFRSNDVRDEDIELLNGRLDPDFEPPPHEMYITLATTNRRADAINEARLAALDAKPFMADAEIKGEFGREYFPAAEELAFKRGAQIMLLNNDADGRWVNGSVGRIADIESGQRGEPIMTAELSSGSSVEIEPYEWKLGRYALVDGQIDYETVGSFRQLPFRLAWAVTIHKGQGATFDRMIIDIDRVFSPGQAYVALSRCTSLEGIVLAKPILKHFAGTDYRVHRFFAEHKAGVAGRRLSESEAVEILEQAISEGREVEVVYANPRGDATERTLVPIRVGKLTYEDSDYLGLNAYCRLRQAERNFRIDRIVNIELGGRSEF